MVIQATLKPKPTFVQGGSGALDFHIAVKCVERVMSLDGAVMQSDVFALSAQNCDRDEFGVMSSKSVLSGSDG